MSTRAQPLYLRIFLSSPGDVADERALALQLFERLQYDPLLRGQITIDAVAWDKRGADAPMLATPHAPGSDQSRIAQALGMRHRAGALLGADGHPASAGVRQTGRQPLPFGHGVGVRGCHATSRRQRLPKVVVYRRIEKVLLDPS